MKPFDIFSPTLQNILVKLEERDREERNVGLNRLQRLRQIPRETGEFLFQFLTVFVSKFPDFVGLEIGTSGGYSTLWQGMALVINGHGRLISLDHDPKKHQLASENIKQTDVNEYVELIQGDAKISLETLMDEEKLSYVFMDCEKDSLFYIPSYSRFPLFLIRGNSPRSISLLRSFRHKMLGQTSLYGLYFRRAFSIFQYYLCPHLTNASPREPYEAKEPITSTIFAFREKFMLNISNFII